MVDCCSTVALMGFVAQNRGVEKKEGDVGPALTTRLNVKGNIACLFECHGDTSHVCLNVKSIQDRRFGCRWKG